MADEWVEVLRVEADVFSIGLLLFREKFGVPDEVPLRDEMLVHYVYSVPQATVYARCHMRPARLAELGIDEAELPLIPSE